jgi:hypothetical protein
MKRRPLLQVAATAVAHERAAIVRFFERQLADVQMLVERGSMDADSVSLLCTRLSTIAEQISIGLHENEEGILS